jgi:large subunit ribosomal protein L2
VLANFEYDPNRTSFLAKMYHPLEEKEYSISYILAPKGIKVFDRLRTFDGNEKNIFLLPGDRTILSNFEAGDLVHAVENLPSKKALFARAAGTFCQILHSDFKEYIKVRLPSGSQRLVRGDAKATLGVLSNDAHYTRNLEKAGRSR